MRLSSIPRVNSNHRKRRYSRRMAVGWMQGWKENGGWLEGAWHSRAEEGARVGGKMKKERRILPSKNLVFAFENLVDARARVCTRLFRFQAAVKADDWKIIRKIVSPRWREKAFPLKACRILRHFIEFAFPFAFSPLFFFFDRCLDLESSFGKYSRKRGWCNYWWEEWKGKGTENIGNTKRWWSRERDVNGGFTAHRLEAARRANGKFSDVIKSWPLLFLLFV